ncbi:MAG: glycogen debranching enzyme, partial [Microbacterium sp.]|nr:glycogen debranching enzyme [Microbacterium sp.]
HRTLQYLATSTPEIEELNRILLVVHGDEKTADVTLPVVEDVAGYLELWSSAHERPADDGVLFAPGDVMSLPATSLRLFRVV